MMRKYFFMVIGLFLTVISGFSQSLSGLPYIKNFSTQDYNAGIQNFALGQDKRGIIYAANNYGLVEYDGTKWRRYSVSNGTKVRSLAVDPSGKIYVGAQDQFGYFFPNEKGQLVYFSLSDQINNSKTGIDEVWYTYIIGSNVYFCTLNSLYEYDGEKIRIIQPNQPLEFAFSVNNQLYVQTPENGLSVLIDTTLSHVPGSEVFQDKTVSGIISYSKDQILISTIDHGIYTYDGSRFSKWKTEVNQYLEHAFTNTLLQLSDSHLAIGTASKGLFIVRHDGSVLYHLNKDSGLNNRTILCLMEDDFGNIWVGQNNGLAKIEYSSPFTFINENSELQGTGYCSYLDKEELFMGTNNGVFKYSLEDSKLAFIPQTEGQVYSIDKYENDLFIGHHEGAIRLTNNRIEKMSKRIGTWRFLIPKTHPDILLEGNYMGFQSYSRNNGKWQSPVIINDFNESSRVFEEDSNGAIWMTHGYKGVFKIQPADDYKSFESVQFYDHNNGFTTNQLINVYRVNNELIFCSAEGIFSYNSDLDQFELNEQFTNIFGSNARISMLEEDAFGNIYFMSSDSTGILKKDRFGDYHPETKIFNKIQQLLNDDLPNIMALDYNQALFGAKEGFIHYNAQKQTKLLEPIQVLIRKVVTTNHDSLVFDGNFKENGIISTQQPSSQNIQFKFANNSILFTFSSTFADELVNTLYSFKLEGFDKDWSDWNNKTEKEYTNLREGKYRFLVKAKNIYDIESDVSSYTFAILPPWYRTNTASFGFFLLVATLIGGILYSQSFRHKKEKRHLTLKQERALIQKDNKLQEFSKKTEAEIISLRNEKLALEINTKNKELATSTMNLLNKNKFLSDLKDSMSHAVTEGKSGDVKKLKDMMKRIERNMAGDSEWEHFQHHFDQVHGDFSHRLIQVYPRLSPQDMKLSTYLRMNLSTKEIAQLLNITVRGAEIARYRLRKKFDLKREDNLTEFILSF